MWNLSLAPLDGCLLLNITLYVCFQNVYEKGRIHFQKVHISFVVFVASTECLVFETNCQNYYIPMFIGNVSVSVGNVLYESTRLEQNIVCVIQIKKINNWYLWDDIDDRIGTNRRLNSINAIEISPTTHVTNDY